MKKRSPSSAKLKGRRAALNLSQAQLARALGVHPRTVAAWEQGRQAAPSYLWLALEKLERGAARDSDEKRRRRTPARGDWPKGAPRRRAAKKEPETNP